MHTNGKCSASGTLIRTPPHEGKFVPGVTVRRLAVCEPSPYMSEDTCKANAARLALGWNLLEAGIVELLRDACRSISGRFGDGSKNNIESDLIEKIESVLSQIPKE